jgi:hypothetical protein
VKQELEMYRSLVLVLLGLWVAGSAFAADAEPSTVVMDEVVVTAGRVVEKVQDQTMSVTVIDAESLLHRRGTWVIFLLKRGLVTFRNIQDHLRQYRFVGSKPMPRRVICSAIRWCCLTAVVRGRVTSR